MNLNTISLAAACTLMFAFSSCASQDIPQDKVPSVVVNAVAKAYPTVTLVEWQKHAQGFEAEFDSDTTELTVLVDNSGTIVQTKRDVTVAELPEAIQRALNINYKDKTVDDVEMVQKAGQTFYQMELEAMWKDTKLVFDEAGKEQKNLAYWE